MKKTTISLTMLAMLMTVMGPITVLRSVEGVWATGEVLTSEITLEDGEVEETVETRMVANEAHPEFLFTVLNPVKGMVSEYELQPNDRHIMQMNELYLATYDFEEYTSAEVERKIEELKSGKQPSWAKKWMSYPLNILYQWTTPSYIWLENGSTTFLRNNPGVFYYAMRIADTTEETEKWIVGKIDYREATYSATSDPHIASKCTGSYSEDGTRYVFTRTEELDGEYMTWEEEFGGILDDRLEDLEVEVEDWDGDLGVKADLTERLEKVRYLAEDTDRTDDERDWVDRLLARLEEREEEIAKAEEERLAAEEAKRKAEEEEAKRKAEEEKRLAEEEARRKEAEKGSSGSGAGGGAAASEPGAGGMGEATDADGTIGSGGGDDDVEIGVGSAENVGNTEDRQEFSATTVVADISEVDGVGLVEEEFERQQEEEPKIDRGSVEIPMLSAPKETVVERKNFWWWIILLIMAVASGLWLVRKWWREKGNNR